MISPAVLKIVMLYFSVFAACLGTSMFNLSHFYQINLFELSAGSLRVSNLLYNTTYIWQIDLLLQRLLASFPAHELFILRFCPLLLFATGIFLFIRLYSRAGDYFLLSPLLTVLVLNLLALLFQYDFGLLLQMAYLPLFLIAVIHFGRNFSSGIFLLGIFALLLLFSAQQLAIWVFLPTLIYLRLELVAANKLKLAVFSAFSIVLLILAASPWFLNSNNLDLSWNYPSSARVLQQDYSPGSSQPLLGEKLKINGQEFLLQHRIYRGFALFLFVLALSYLGLRYYQKRSLRVLLPLYVISIPLLLSVVVSEKFYFLNLIYTFSSLHSSTATLSLLPVLLLFVLLLLIYRSCDRETVPETVCLLLLLGAGAFANYYYISQQDSTARKISLIRALDSQQTASISQQLFSPSAAVALELANTPERQALKTKLIAKFQRIGAKKLIISSNYNQAEIGLLYDRNLGTIWSSKLAAQTGDEEITITFNQQLRIKGIMLQTGEKYSDYPRGISLLARTDCSGEDYQPLLSVPQWHGTIYKTRAGLPYYGPTHEVTLNFKPQQVCGFKIRQTSKDKNYEWSVAEIKFWLLK